MDPLGPFWTSYLAGALLCTIAELAWPARKLRYRKALPLDVIAAAVYQLAVFPAAAYVCLPAATYVLDHLSATVAAIWLPPRLLTFYLLTDLGSYWLHRLMHTRHLWRVHRWHHSPQQLYWLAGVRATIPQQILFNLPAIAALPILAGAPGWVTAFILMEGVIRNDWMHMNVSWRSSWLERVLVTPRYHHIHHSADAAEHDGNYGSLFSIWDRLFGTYIDPDKTTPRKFGTGEPKRDPVLLMIGI